MTLKETAVTVAIAVLFTTFVLVTIDALYPRPEYEKFCNNTYYPSKIVPASANCTYQQSPEEVECYNQEGMPETDYDENGCSYYRSCNYCSRDFNNAQKEYNNTFFLILAPLGALAIILGVYYSVEFLGSGFMFSGIILMFWGTVQNFSDLDKFMRVAVIFAELLLVLFIAYKKIIPQKANPKNSKK